MSCYDNTKPLRGQRIYDCWLNMKSRCYYPNNNRYHRYGARGITVCKEWRDDFLSFVSWADENGYEDHLTLDRKDNNENYCPENCSWETQLNQSRNKKHSRIWNIEGKEFLSAQEACEFFGVSRKTIQHWCNGQKCRDKFYPPKEGCSSKLRYSKVPSV